MRLQNIAAVLLLGLAAHAQETRTVRTEFLANYDDVTKKIVALAEAIPAEKYSWRPAPGVRSISELFVHIAGANFMIPTTVGVKPPAGAMPQNAEKTMTAKDEIVAALKKSVDHSRTAISTALEGDPNKPTKVFGRESTFGGASLLMVSHLHEHLGQGIAYARSNGVTPPWSRGRGE